MLTPESLTTILSKGAITVGSVDANMQRLTDVDTTKVFDTLWRIKLTKPVEFQINVGEAQNEGSVSLHFEGNGWKLSGIQLLTAVVQVLAKNLIKNPGRSR